MLLEACPPKPRNISAQIDVGEIANTESTAAKSSDKASVTARLYSQFPDSLSVASSAEAAPHPLVTVALFNFYPVDFHVVGNARAGF